MKVLLCILFLVLVYWVIKSIYDYQPEDHLNDLISEINQEQDLTVRKILKDNLIERIKGRNLPADILFYALKDIEEKIKV